MKIALAAGLAAGTLLLAMQPAHAWARRGWVATPRGVWTGRSHGATLTGPAGESVTRSGSVTRSSPGQYSSTRTTTGPNGGTVTRTGSTSCAGGSCSHGGTVTTVGAAAWEP